MMGSSGLTPENISAAGLKIAVVASRYNLEICDGLLNGALIELSNLGALDAAVKVFRVPGAFELPFFAKLLAKKFDAVVCLGVVIRGDTAHFDYVCQGVTQGLQLAMLATETPMAFGVLTTDTIAQAQERSADDGHNKGREAARTAVEMVHLKKQV